MHYFQDDHIKRLQQKSHLNNYYISFTTNLKPAVLNSNIMTSGLLYLDADTVVFDPNIIRMMLNCDHIKLTNVTM